MSFTTLQEGIPGDVDGDDGITINDVSALVSYLMGQIQLTGQTLQNADLDGDNEVTINDVSVLLMMIMNQ